jgi:hypothetical protein
MKRLEPFTFDFPQCRQQIGELEAWLKSKDELSEGSDIRPFFRDRPQMASLIGMCNPSIFLVDRVGWEFDIFGDFKCDLAVGTWAKGAYCFIEFEDARKASVFQQQGGKATREWGKRFDHGYSQIIDWAHKLDGLNRSQELLARFGRYEIDYEMVLLIGRHDHLDDGERQRLRWRSEKVSVNTKRVLCMTFDALLDQLRGRLATLSIAAGATPPPS